MNVKYIEQNCKSILHKINRTNLPFKWGVNPYRGCIHSCIYCYARYTHSYLDLDPKKEFETTIIVKTNAPQILRREFSSPKWKKDLVNLGSVCDPYQAAEKKYSITREMLKVFKQYHNPVTIATKSNLILRDLDILSEMTQESYVNIVFSISSINEKIRKEIEPRAASTQQRLQAISILRDSGLKVGVLLMPIVPFLNDSDDELETIFQAIADSKASFVIPGIMYLQGASKTRFFDFIENEHPELIEKYNEFYKNRSPPLSYKNRKHSLFKILREKYNLDNFNNMMIQGKDRQKSLIEWIKK